MPLYYGKPIDEHHAVRKQGGVFDISHMGQFEARGQGAMDFLNHALPNDVAAMTDGEALYSPLCREDGGVLDDLIIYQYSPSRYHIIVNAGTREKDWLWLNKQSAGYEVELTDLSSQRVLFAVQGPEVFERLRPLLKTPPGSLRYYTFCENEGFGVPIFSARTGYTGEPGCELSVQREHAAQVWEALTSELKFPPIGLAARDTLRLEACMGLYGHELRESWHPFESGLAWAVKVDKAVDFVGKQALRGLKTEENPYRLAGVEVTGRGIPREGYPVCHEGQPVGVITSGALSPTTGRAVGLARLQGAYAKLNTPLTVEIRGKAIEALVVRRPFYQNPAVRA